MLVDRSDRSIHSRRYWLHVTIRLMIQHDDYRSVYSTHYHLSTYTHYPSSALSSLKSPSWLVATHIHHPTLTCSLTQRLPFPSQQDKLDEILSVLDLSPANFPWSSAYASTIATTRSTYNTLFYDELLTLAAVGECQKNTWTLSCWGQHTLRTVHILGCVGRASLPLPGPIPPELRWLFVNAPCRTR